MVLCHVPLCCSSRWLSFPGAGRRPRRRARDTMADRWSYASNASWVPGENIPALQSGGANGEHTLNAAGMQLFGNCVSNLERLPMKTLMELYHTLKGHQGCSGSGPDAVSVAALLGGVRPRTARQWYASLNSKGWSAAFKPGKSHIKLAVGKSGTESAVGNPETDLTALPDTLPVVVDVAETRSEPDCDLDSFVPKVTRARLETWREHSNFAIGLRMAELATMWYVHGWQKDAVGECTNLLKQQAPDFDRKHEPFGKIFEWVSGIPHSGMPHWHCKFVAHAAACNRHTILLVSDHRCCLDQQCQLVSNNPHVHLV